MSARGEMVTVTIREYGCDKPPGTHIHERTDLACVACYRETQWDALHEPHDQGGLRDIWKCKNDDCGRWYPESDYRRAVAHAAFVSAEWLPIDDASARTGVKAGTIRVWATRDKVRKRPDADSGRTVYSITDIEECKTPEEAA